MRIRPADISDAESIAEIYNSEVSASTATFDLVPRSLADQRTWLIDRSGAHAVLVAELDDGSIAGFASLSPFHSRPAYSTTVENSVYVHTDRRRSGIALALMEALIETARSHGFHSMIARISGAESSVALHKKLGFEQVGVEREVGRKFGRWLDVTILQLML